MKKIESGAKRIICSNPDSLFCYFGWPSVTRLPDGTLAMAASGFRLKHICPFGKAVICYSRDEGKSWTAPAVALDTPLDDRDAGLVVFGGGRVMLTSFNNTIAAQRNWNGVTSGEHRWTEDVRRDFSEAYLKVLDSVQPEEKYLGSTYRISEDGGYTFGPIRRAPVTTPHGPAPLRDGGLLYVGRRFSPDDHYTPFEENIACCKLNKNDEFEFVSSIGYAAHGGESTLSCEPYAIELPDGKIVVHIRVQRLNAGGLFTLYQCESYDGGLHFTEPHQILDDFGGSPAHLYLHSGGTLICSYGYREAPYGIRMAFSRDGGETWDTDHILSDDGLNGDLGYPATVELRDGSLLTVFYENIGGQSVIMQKNWKIPDLSF